jgi:hypothetical protein
MDPSRTSRAAKFEVLRQKLEANSKRPFGAKDNIGANNDSRRSTGRLQPFEMVRRAKDELGGRQTNVQD